jgi:hypothetical protein
VLEKRFNVLGLPEHQQEGMGLLLSPSQKLILEQDHGPGNHGKSHQDEQYPLADPSDLPEETDDSRAQPGYSAYCEHCMTSEYYIVNENIFTAEIAEIAEKQYLKFKV